MGGRNGGWHTVQFHRVGPKLRGVFRGGEWSGGGEATPDDSRVVHAPQSLGLHQRSVRLLHAAARHPLCRQHRPVRLAPHLLPTQSTSCTLAAWHPLRGKDGSHPPSPCVLKRQILISQGETLRVQPCPPCPSVFRITKSSIQGGPPPLPFTMAIKHCCSAAPLCEMPLLWSYPSRVYSRLEMILVRYG